VTPIQRRRKTLRVSRGVVTQKKQPPTVSRSKCGAGAAVAEPIGSYGAPGGEIVLCRAPDGRVSLDVRLEKDTLDEECL
jgi:hypothetical protein